MDVAVPAAVVVLSCLLVGSVTAIIVARLRRHRDAARREERLARVRPIVVAAAAGDAPPDRVLDADERVLLAELVIDYMGKVRGDGHQRLRALLARGAILDPMRAELVSRSPVRRARAATVLGAARDQRARGAVEAMLDDPDFEVRVTAVRALGEIGDVASVPALLGRVDVGGRGLPFGTVTMALLRIGQPSVDALCNVLAGGRAQGRSVAAEVLGLLGAVEAVPTVVRALHDDPVIDVRIRAARALGRIGSPRAVQPLLAALHDPDPSLCAVAARALGELGAAGDEVVDALVAAVRPDQTTVAINAAAALDRLGPAGRAALDRLVGGDEPFAVVAAGEALRTPRPGQAGSSP